MNTYLWYWQERRDWQRIIVRAEQKQVGDLWLPRAEARARLHGSLLSTYPPQRIILLATDPEQNIPEILLETGVPVEMQYLLGTIQLPAELELSGHASVRRQPLFPLALWQKQIPAADEPWLYLYLGQYPFVSLGVGKKLVDVLSYWEGEGPLGPLSTGQLPTLAWLEWLCQQKLSGAKAQELVRSKGGIAAYLGREWQPGEKLPPELASTVVYQSLKGLGSLWTLSQGQARRLVLAGELLLDQQVLEPIQNWAQARQLLVRVLPAGEEF